MGPQKVPKATKVIRNTKHFRVVESTEGTQGIQCLKCAHTSWNPYDLRYEYCSRCKRFHGDNLRELMKPKGSKQ